MRVKLWFSALRAVIRDLNPGYFALVMATGIVSRAMGIDGASRLSGLLLGVEIVAYVLLVVAYTWRFLGYRREFLADVSDPRRAFAFFTFVAASNLLAARLAGDGHTWEVTVLLAIGGAAWLLLNYGIPLLLAGRHGPQPPLAGANGTWFVWVVGTQSIAVAITSLPPPVSEARAALAVGCWAVGVVLYLLIATLVCSALLQYPVRPAEITPPYWVFMGSTAISVLAGAQILRLRPDPLTAGVHGVVSGISVVLWAFGTWLVPLLLAAGIWRHVWRRVPLRYEPGLWSMVFPVGMYGVASHELGTALGVSWLATLGRAEAWLALAVWVVVFAAMAGAWAWRLARLPTTHAPGTA
jgi:tellurite resistance protein TehA-like permease